MEICTSIADVHINYHFKFTYITYKSSEVRSCKRNHVLYLWKLTQHNPPKMFGCRMAEWTSPYSNMPALTIHPMTLGLCNTIYPRNLVYEFLQGQKSCSRSVKGRKCLYMNTTDSSTVALTMMAPDYPKMGHYLVGYVFSTWRCQAGNLNQDFLSLGTMQPKMAPFFAFIN